MTTVLPDEIIDECRRRIEARYPPTVLSALIGDGGEPATAAMLEVERLRACQDRLLAMTPLPSTFRSDHYWQGYPPGFRFQTFVNQVAAPAQQMAPQPVYQPAPQVTQPQIIVVPSGGQNVSYGAPSQGQPQFNAPGQQAAPQGYASAPVHFFPPPAMGGPPPHAVEMPAAAPHHAAPAPAPTPAVPSTVVASEPPPIPHEIWSPGKEAMHTAAVRALQGDHSSVSLLQSFADEVGMDLVMFCQRVISERARTVAIWKQMEGRAQ